MSAADLILIAITYVMAATIDTVVGSGTLVPLRALLAAGVPPAAANVANKIGLTPGP